MVVQLVWQSEPIVLANATRDYGQRIIQGLHALGDLFAAKIQAYAQANARWRDQTGAARQGLRGFAEKTATGLLIVLTGSVFYQIYLELKNGGRYAIIMQAMEAFYGPIMAALRALVGGR